MIDNFDCKVNGCSWGCAPAQLWQVRLQSTNTEFQSLLPSLCLKTGLLEEKVVSFLQYWLPSRVNKVLMLFKFWAVMIYWPQIFFLWEMKFDGFCKNLLQTKAVLITTINLLSLTGLWVKIGHRNKSACSNQSPVQSSRSKPTTCIRKLFLLRFQRKSTATSYGGRQKPLGTVSGMIFNLMQIVS